MRWILFLTGVLAGLGGGCILINATSIFQEIAGLVAVVDGGILFSAGAIVDAIVDLKREIRKITGPAEELERLRDNIKTGSRTLGSGQM